VLTGARGATTVLGMLHDLALAGDVDRGLILFCEFQGRRNET
jgi:hypothetical protein